MSISPLDPTNQTTTIPNSLLGYSSNGISAIEILPTSITIAGDLNTATPIYVGISASTGLTTTLATGLDVNCDFNMNGNDITNLDTLSSTIGVAMNINGDDNLSLTAGGDLNLTGDANVYITASNTSVEISSYDGLNISSITSGISFSTNGTEVQFSNCPISMNSNNITNIDTLSSASGGDLTLSASNQVILNSIDNVNINAGENFFVSTNTTTGTIQFNSPTPTYFNTATANTADGVISVAEINRNNGDITINSQSDNLFLQSTTGMSLNVSNGALTLTSSGAGIVLTTDQDFNLDAEDNITISNAIGYTNSIVLDTTSGDTSITSNFGSVNISSGNGDAGTSNIALYAVEGDITLNTGGGYQVSSNAPITSSIGYTGNVYHSDNPTGSGNYYLTFVQSGGVSGYYLPNFDSATLTYNPLTNLLNVAGLQLSGATNTPTFATGVLNCGCNESSSRQFQFGMTADITGLTLSNRRTNGVYTCSLYNVSGSTWTISNVLTGSASNKTDYASPISVANGEFAVLTARTLLTNGTAYNYVSVMKFA
jgi:uncharacterized protein (DUF2345 family)